MAPSPGSPLNLDPGLIPAGPPGGRAPLRSPVSAAAFPAQDSPPQEQAARSPRTAELTSAYGGT